MTEQERVNRIYRMYPERHQAFFNRPHLSRRGFFELLGAGVTCSFVAPSLIGQQAAQDAAGQAGVTTINKAKNVVFILLTGAISHTDTFDFKMVNGVTPP